MKITVVLLSYKRVQNLSKIIDSIKAQTVDTKLIVWNNNPDLNLS
jgi:GT2 family glycosyltransferase